MRRFAGAFRLNDDVLFGTTVQSTSYDSETRKWTLKLRPSGELVVCSQLVLATGVCSSVPLIPEIRVDVAYKGMSIHSNTFKNGRLLADDGVKVR